MIKLKLPILHERKAEPYSLYCMFFVSFLSKARAIRRRVTKPRLVRETDLPGSPPAALAAWMARRGRAMVLPLLGRSRRCR